MKSLLTFLDEVDAHPCLYTNKRILTRALYRYEHIWVPLLTKIPASQRMSILPPLDVHWVWFCHLLNPRQYVEDSVAMWAAAGGKESNYIIDHRFLPVTSIPAARQLAQQLWSQHFPTVPFHLDDLPSAPLEDTDIAEHSSHASVVKYDILLAASRQMLFHYQVSLPHYRHNHGFLQAAKCRYEKFLYLAKLSPKQQIAPTYDIDLAWHAHMAHPRVYKNDTEERCGRHFPHDDTINDRVSGGKLETIWKATMKLWWDTYKECIGKDGGMWRGNVDVGERRLRELLEEHQQEIGDKVEQGEDQFVEEVTEEKGLFTAAQQEQWGSVEWVHARQYLQKDPQGVMQTCEMSRWTKVSQLMQGRVVHAMTAEGMGDGRLAQAVEFMSLVEVFRTGGSGYPIASANVYLERPVDYPYGRVRSVVQAAQRQTLLLRVCGQDLGLLTGVWTRDHGMELGMLFVKDVQPKWSVVKSVGEDVTKPKVYQVDVPVGKNGDQKKWIRFDLATGRISAECSSMIVHAYLMCLAAGVLHVRTQRKFVPRNGSMYSQDDVDQSRFAVLRGVGGERRKDGKKSESEGYWWMRTYGDGCSIEGFGEERSGFLST